MKKLEIKELSKSFKNRNRIFHVLENINFNVNDGEFVCIVGPSGCGKTTLLNLISGLDSEYKGQIFHNEKEIMGIGSERLMIFQELGLFPWLTVQQNVEFGLKMKFIPKKERQENALKYLKMVGLDKLNDLYIHELSGGMKQRVALARALVMNPEILLMDEPFASLDAQTRDLLHVELQKIWENTKKTIIFVTHNIREAVCLSDKIILFSAQPGKIKMSIQVNLPRPRHIEDHGLMKIVKIIFKELRCEMHGNKTII